MSFGSFSQGPDGRFLSGNPRPRFRLTAPFGFRDPGGRVWQVPAGVEVDGASIPRAFWTAIGGPFDGNYLHASVVHDHFCRTRTRSAEDTHRTFYFGMRAKNVPDNQAKLMFWAVSTFGPKWRLVLRPGAEGLGMGAEVQEAEPVTEADLEDPATVAEAKARFEAVARSLEASDGARFESTAGERDASLENLEADAARVRDAVEGGGQP
jgi:hypothetical protein